jgi:hypothetical protein
MPGASCAPWSAGRSDFYPAAGGRVFSPTGLAQAVAEAFASGWTVSSGNPRSRQPWKPPASGRTRVMPRFLSSSATRALEASFGQVQ